MYTISGQLSYSNPQVVVSQLKLKLKLAPHTRTATSHLSVHSDGKAQQAVCSFVSLGSRSQFTLSNESYDDHTQHHSPLSPQLSLNSLNSQEQ